MSASRTEVLDDFINWNKVLGWSLVVFAALLASAFGAAPEGSNGFSVPNLLGPIGTFLRDLVVRPFGVASFFVCFVLVHVGQRFLVGRHPGSPITRVMGTLVAVICLGAFFQALAPEKSFPGGEVPMGGILGHWLYQQVAPGLGGAMLFGLTSGLASLAAIILATDDLVAEFLRGVRPNPLRDERATGDLDPALESDDGAVGTAVLENEAEDLAGEVDVVSEEEALAVAEPAPAPAKKRRKAARKKTALVEETEEASAAASEEEVAEAAPAPRIKVRETEEVSASRALDAEAPTTEEDLTDEESASVTAPATETDETAADDASAEDGEWEWDETEGSEEEGEWEEGEEEGEWEEDGEWAEGDEEGEWEEEEAWEDEAEPAQAEGATEEEAAADEAPAAGDEPSSDDDQLPFDPDPAPSPGHDSVEPEVAPPARPRIRGESAAGGDGLQIIRLDRGEGIKKRDKYPLPPLEALAEPKYLKHRESNEILTKKAGDLVETLADFGVEAQVPEIERGPVITRFDLTLARGTRIAKVTNLADDVALKLGVGRVRIAPVSGKSALGVEVPNADRETVYLRDVAVATESKLAKTAIPLYLGKDSSGVPLVEDLASTPHLLIAGRTGAGKSVFVNSLILSILLTRRPEDVRLIMIDPKKVELEVYQEIPHLLTPVESNAKRATKILEWAVDQMEERYELLSACGVRHLTSYNKLTKKVRDEKLSRIYPEDVLPHLPEKMPYMVIIVDELADLMMAAGKEVENAIARLAQKARAVGIHVVLATQRPSTDVITGLIKSNLPARIAFQTRTGIDSRTILDRYGAEKLLDKGDMLYLSSKSDDPKRIQGPFVSDAEVEAVVDYLRETASPFYARKLEQVNGSEGTVAEAAARDELFDQAVEVVMTTGQASASFLQRRLQVGYARGSRLIDLMSEAGIVSEHRGSKAREILISPEQWEEMRGQSASG